MATLRSQAETLALGTIVSAVRDLIASEKGWLQPDEVFDESALGEWAKEHGYHSPPPRGCNLTGREAALFSVLVELRGKLATAPAEWRHIIHGCESETHVRLTTSECDVLAAYMLNRFGPITGGG